MVAISFANLATDLLVKGEYGKMVALREGKYTVVPLTLISEGRKRVDVPELYDKENYLPKVTNMMNKPMFLY
jgi:6-phosphofructokinase 1